MNIKRHHTNLLILKSLLYHSHKEQALIGKKKHLVNLLGVKLEKSYEKYLGLLVILDWSLITNFRYLENKIANKLRSWHV